MATLFKTDGTIKTVEPKNGTDFTLEELKEMVNGYIETVPTKDGSHLIVVNEEGKLEGLSYNANATVYVGENTYLAKDDYIVGNMLVCKVQEIQ